MVLVRRIGAPGGQDRPEAKVMAAPVGSLATAKGSEPVSDGEPLQSVTVNTAADAADGPIPAEKMVAVHSDSDASGIAHRPFPRE
jgi:hypothetical protein